MTGRRPRTHLPQVHLLNLSKIPVDILLVKAVGILKQIASTALAPRIFKGFSKDSPIFFVKWLQVNPGNFWDRHFPRPGAIMGVKQSVLGWSGVQGPGRR